MAWLTLMTLTDGSEVQSFMPSPPDAEPDTQDHEYRIRHEDGSIVEFADMVKVHLYVRAHYDLNF